MNYTETESEKRDMKYRCDCLKVFLASVPKEYLPHPEISEAALNWKSWKAHGRGKRQLSMAVQRTGMGGKRSSRRQRSRHAGEAASALHTEYFGP